MNRTVLLVAAGFLALHLVIAAFLPLISDETYYALWSGALDWDYYDHPPMIAAMIRAGTELFGLTPLGIRLVPMLAMAATTLLVGGIANQMTRDEMAAARAALYFNLGFLALGVGSFATPDVPSTLFWALATYAALKATEEDGGLRWGQPRWGLGWWILAGLACGLGVMSKFTNLFLTVGLFGWLILSRPGRESLRRPGPWVAILCAVLVVVPLIAWNLTHHGLGFERQFGRIAGSDLSFGTFGQYLLILLVIPTPLIGLFALLAVAGWSGKGRGLLLWSVAPLLIYFAVHALHGTVELNWPMPATPAFAVLAALVAPGFGRGWQRAAVISGALLSFGLLGLLFNPWRPIGAADNPPNQTRGWTATLAEIATSAKDARADWIATTDYSLTGRLWIAFPALSVFSVTEPQRWGFRGGFPAQLCALPGLLIEPATDNPALASGIFRDIDTASEIVRRFAGVKLQTYRLRPVSHVLDKGLCPDAG
ncbi:MAG: ArnT family glycosyltransferase [Cypionkella sp.]